MSVQAIARRYATALADITLARNEALEVHEELTGWAEMMQSNGQLQEILRNPTVVYDQKQRMVSALIERTRVRPTTANFLQVLLQNQRLADLPEINRNFAQELDRRSGTITAQITTARPVEPAARESLRSKLAQLTNSSVRLQFAVDEELIGGIVTRIGSTVYDGSVRNQLEQVKDRMIGEK